jgi:hypothetical protein
MSDLTVAVRIEILMLGLSSLLELNPGADFLTEEVIMNADNLGICYIRVLHQVLFNLAGINVLTSSDNHVLGSAYNLNIALFIYHSKVSCVHPAIDYRLFSFLFISPIAFHDGIATSADFSWLSPREDLSGFWVCNFNFTVGTCSSHSGCFLELSIMLIAHSNYR